MVKLVDGYWTDENSNVWNSEIYTESQAIVNSASLINCKNCINCDSCDSCNSCDSCYSCYSCNSCDSCRSCRFCNSCYSCNSCDSCRCCDSSKEMKSQPQIYTSQKMGSRDDYTTFYFYDDIIYVKCGCFYGDLVKFEEAVKETHGKNEHAERYIKEIAKVKMIFEVE